MEGIIVGCDRNQEWLLAWWWSHYSAHNTRPVTFVNFGLTTEAIAWCKERGDLLDLTGLNSSEFIKEPEGQLREKWEARYGKELWSERHAWFKKPFACLSSPYSETIWIDLDCEVKGNLSPLFQTLHLGFDLGLCPESESVQQLHHTLEFLRPGEVNYNSGVIVFRKGDAIDFWVEQTVTCNDLFIGDQQSLSRSLFLRPCNLFSVPAAFNWSPSLGQNDLAVVVHYHGGVFKQLIPAFSR
jgi:hypothetical protein